MTPSKPNCLASFIAMQNNFECWLEVLTSAVQSAALSHINYLALVQPAHSSWKVLRPSLSDQHLRSAPNFDILLCIFSSTLYLTLYFVTTADETAELSQPRLLYHIGQIPGTRKTSNTETNDFTREAISEEIPDQFFSPWKSKFYTEAITYGRTMGSTWGMGKERVKRWAV